MKRFWKVFLPSFALVSVLILLGSLFIRFGEISGALAAGEDPVDQPYVSEPVTPFEFNGDVRDLPLARAWKPGDPTYERTRRLYPSPDSKDAMQGEGQKTQGGQIATLQGDQANLIPSISGRDFSTQTVNIEGISFTGVWPPDTVGEVGPNHYIQMVNGSPGTPVQIFDKAGNSLAGPFDLDSLWTAGGDCASGRGDPIVLYDGLADRWLMSEFATNNNHLCVYISQTPNPVTGGYFLYDFPTPNFPDYPKYGVWPDAYYVSSNEASPAVYALDRTQMLAGAVATSQRFTAPSLAGFPFQALIPSDLDGPTAPPGGAPNYFMRHRDDEVHNVGSNDPTQDFLEIWELSVDFATPANSTFTGPTNIPIAEIDSDLCGLSSFFCFPQPGTATTLDPLREVVMWRLQYRNFGSHETLVGNLVTDVDGTDHGGIRWFEMRKTGANPWTLFQEGTHAPDADHRWMGSIAMDGSGNIALGYSVSSSTVFPSIRYAGRLAGDPLGTLPQGEYSLIAGAGSQTGVTRWGDYSAMSVDPADDCTFWYTNEYMPASGNWQTRISAFRFDSCGSADFTLSVDPGSQQVCVPDDAVYDITVGQVASFTDSVTLSAVGVPTGYSDGFSVNPVIPPGASVMTLTHTGGAVAGSYSFDVVGMAPTSTHTATVGLDLFASVPGAPVLSTPADGAVGVSTTPTLEWGAVAQSEDYFLEVAGDPGFSFVVYTATVAGTSHTVGAPLNNNTPYYWRVRSENACGTGVFSAPFSFTTVGLPGDCSVGQVPVELFSDDFESGAPGWTSGGPGNTWALSGANPHAGSFAYHADDIASVSEQYLESPAVALPTGQSPLTLQFWNYQELEDSGAGCFDGGLLDISVGGGPWTQVTSGLLTDPYDGPISNAWSNPRADDDAWCGDPQPYLNSVIDLDSYAGQTVAFRFVMATDSSVSHPGWDVDDVKLQSCLAVDVGTLTGQVDSAVTGQGLDGAQVVADDGSSLFGTSTNPAGFYLQTLPVGTYTVTASASGYMTSTVSGVVILTDTTTTQDFVLDAPGMAVDPDEFDITVGLGFSVTLPLNLTNNGTLANPFDLVEQDGGFMTTTVRTVDPNAVPERLGLTAPSEASNIESVLADVVQDGSFEAGTPNPFWNEASTNFGTPICDVGSCGTGTGTGPRTGSFWTWFGGIAAYEEGSVNQDVTVPVGAASLSFYLEQIVCDSPADYMEVTIDGTQVFLTDGSSPLCGSLGYTLQVVDVSAFADGGVHTLEFHSEVFASNGGNSNFFVDDVTLDATANPDVIWLAEDPITGTLAASSSLIVDVLFDASVVTDTGKYFANLVVNSADPENGMISIPITMTVVTASFGVDLSPDMALSGMPGETVTYTIDITNTGNVLDIFDLTLAGDVWSTTLSDSTILLNPGEVGSFMVFANIPALAADNDSDAVTVTATSQADPGTSDSVQLTTTSEWLKNYLPTILKNAP